MDGFYTILKTEITYGELNKADEKFHRFIARTLKFFGPKNL